MLYHVVFIPLPLKVRRVQQVAQASAGGVSDGSLPTLGSATASTTSWSWFTRGAAEYSII